MTTWTDVELCETAWLIKEARLHGKEACLNLFQTGWNREIRAITSVYLLAKKNPTWGYRRIRAKLNADKKDGRWLITQRLVLDVKQMIREGAFNDDVE